MRKLNGKLIRRLNARLEEAYGRPVLGRPLPVLDSLILTILSQNTNDRNSGEGFVRLKRAFPTWEQAAAAPASSIAAAIKISGLSRIKAPRIKHILKRVKEDRGDYSLNFLRKMGVAEARDYLGRFRGVGPKTVACVLLFSCGKPVFPVDTHVLRVSERLGLIDRRKTAEQAHLILGGVVPPDIVYPFHVLMIWHGRKTCRAGRPACERCVLRRHCGARRRGVKSKTEPRARQQ